MPVTYSSEDGHSEGDGNTTPYAGEARTQYAQDPAGGGGSSRMPRAIPGDSLHSTFRGYPQPATSVEPYAAKGSDATARREDSHQVNDRNTNAGQRDGTNPYVKVAFTNDSSLDVPGDLTPYANESRTVATRRDADGC